MDSLAHGFTSPLRYPGGKGMLANFMKLVISQNGLLDGHYVEVYAGGAGVAWPLVFEEYVQHIHINDLNRSVYSFWKSVLENTEEFCKLIYDTPVTIREWHRQKNIQLDPKNHSPLELGFSTFFLNRTNRSGIITGGVIGGKAQTGKWKLDARFNKGDLSARIQCIARYASRISVYRLDAAEFIAQVIPLLPHRALIYLDPPYYSKGKDLYEDHYSHEDHIKIAKLVSRHIKQPWIVSYDAAPEILDLYGRYRSIQYNLSYSAQERYAGTEIMYFSRNLIIPVVTHPAQVKMANQGRPLL